MNDKGHIASPTKVRAVIYCRVSTDAQERDGTSLDTQERACLDYAHMNGWHVVECIRETASGYTLDRPGVERIRRLLRDRRADVVVSYAVDRLSRNQNQIGVLFDEAETADARLEFVTEKFEDTAVGRFILAARAFIAEVEREKIKERTMRGKAARARSGRLPQATGKGMYGYRYNPETGKREIIPEQAEIVRRIFTSFAQGTAIVALANQLNAEGVPAFSGGPWHSATIYRMLRNATYTGRTIYRRTVANHVRDPRTGKRRRRVEIRDPSAWIDVADATPAIIDEATFAAVQTILDDPERLRRGRRLSAYALSGHLRCLRCGSSMVGQTLLKKFRYYRCRRAFAGPRGDRCDATYVRADELERLVRQEVGRVLADPGLLARAFQAACGRASDASLVAALQAQLDNLDAQRRRLARLYQLGEIDDDYLEKELRTLRARRKAVEEQLSRMQSSRGVPSQERMAEACERVRAWVETVDASGLALLADALQIRISVETGEARLTGVIPDRFYVPACSHADVRAMVRNRSAGWRSRSGSTWTLSD